MVQMFIFETWCDFYFLFICFLKELINLICFIFFFSLSPIFFLLFRMDGHLFILLHTMGMKNVLSYWFKLVQMLIFKTRCDFFNFVYFLKELIILICFRIFLFSLSQLLFCYLEWKGTSTWCCIKRTWKMCWIIDSKGCKCSSSRQGVIFLFVFIWKNDKFIF